MLLLNYTLIKKIPSLLLIRLTNISRTLFNQTSIQVLLHTDGMVGFTRVCMYLIIAIRYYLDTTGVGGLTINIKQAARVLNRYRTK